MICLPYTGRQRRDCQKCFGEVKYVLKKDARKTTKPSKYLCVWCARPFRDAA